MKIKKEIKRSFWETFYPLQLLLLLRLKKLEDKAAEMIYRSYWVWLIESQGMQPLCFYQCQRSVDFELVNHLDYGCLLKKQSFSVEVHLRITKVWEISMLFKKPAALVGITFCYWPQSNYIDSKMECTATWYSLLLWVFSYRMVCQCEWF